jgi:hypothetical protein
MIAANSPQIAKFRLGQVVSTPGALSALGKSRESAASFLARHVAGDWGDVDAGDWKLNDEAIAHEGDLDQQSRVLSSYKTRAGEKIWIITEADRSSTCVLLPDEY